MPREDHRADAHVGDREVAPGVRGRDQRLIVREDEVGLRSAGRPMRAALVAHVEVEQRPRHVAASAAPGLPGARRAGARAPVRVAGVDPRAATHAVRERGVLL